MAHRTAHAWSLVAWRERPTYRKALDGQVMHATRAPAGWMWSVRDADEREPHARGVEATRRRTFLAAEAAAHRASPTAHLPLPRG